MGNTIRNIRNRGLTFAQTADMPGLQGIKYRMGFTFKRQEDEERRTRIIAGSAITIGVLASAITLYYLFGDKSKSD
jgi:hypothetical protein